MNRDLHIVYASSERYLQYLSVAMGSAYLWASDKSRIVIDVLAMDVTDEVWRSWIDSVTPHLPQGARIVKHSINSVQLKGLSQWHGSMAIYARLLLPNILQDVSWCVCADVDTLFTTDPLDVIPLFDNHFAIIGRCENTVKPLEQERKWFVSRGLPFDKQKYFCAGFILMNLKMFRDKKYGEKCFEFLQRHPDVQLPDQDALNAVCFDDAGCLPYEWGVFGNEAFAKGRPCVIHYPGHNPWHFLDAMFLDYLDAYNIWFRYAKSLYGKTWRDYIRTSPNVVKYLRMRILGYFFSFLRYVFTFFHLLWIPKIGRYLRRHYSSYAVWNAINSINNKNCNNVNSSLQTNCCVKKRDPFFDLVKALAIFLVIFGHIEFLSPNVAFHEIVDNFRICVNMPLFFIISGYFAWPLIEFQNLSRLFKVVRSYFAPAVFASVIFTLCGALAGFVQYHYIIIRFVRNIIFDYWFLDTLSECLVLMFFAFFISRKYWFVFLIGVVFTIVCRPQCIGLKLHFNFFVNMLPCYVFGAIVLRKLNLRLWENWKMGISCLLAFSAFVLLEGDVATNGMSFYTADSTIRAFTSLRGGNVCFKADSGHSWLCWCDVVSVAGAQDCAAATVSRENRNADTRNICLSPWIYDDCRMEEVAV